MTTFSGLQALCNKCILPSHYPGITFSEDGVCNHCQLHEKETNDGFHRDYERDFQEIIGSFKSKSNYDCLLAFSGGKDSTFALQLLKRKYGLNILAYTFDNGFLSDSAKANIKNITEQLNVDNLILSPSIGLLRKLFIEAASNKNLYSQAALMRASAICTTCINFVRYSALKVAVERDIPSVAFGWAPGQLDRRSIIFRPDPSFLLKMQEVFITANGPHLDACRTQYFLTQASLDGGKKVPYFVNPLLFNDYKIEEIKSVIEDLGWKNPKDTDSNSTNCLLNTLANFLHEKRFGYNPYVQEISGMIRNGIISRSEGLLSMQSDFDMGVLSDCAAKLQIKPRMLEKM